MGLLIGILSLLLHIWDFITYPVFLIIDKPWQKTRLMGRTRARIVNHGVEEVTIKPLATVSRIKDELKRAPEEVNTMDRLFKYCSKKYGRKNCMGTRLIIGELEEKQENGKVFTKLQLGDYTWQSYAEVAQQADNLGRGLRETGGLQPKDKIVIYANTCAEWMITAVAAFKHSLAVVTIYTNLGQEGVLHGISQTEAGTVVVGQDLLPTLLAILPGAPSVRNVIVIPSSYNPEPLPDDTETVTFQKWTSVVATGESSNEAASPPGPEDTAIIMYTSGSTGVPKGVVLTHANLIQALLCISCAALDSIDPISEEDCYIALLPLAHVLELLAENVMLVTGIPIGYSNTKTFTDTGTMVAKGYKGDASLLRPTVIALVPLVIDTIYKGIRAKVAARGAGFAELIDFCYKYRLKWVRRGHDTPVMNKLIFSKFREIVGGRIRVLVSGGAPLAPDAHDFIRTCLGITLLQGYGLTETTATACIPDASDVSTGTVGPPLQEVDIRIASWEEGGYKVTDSQGPRGEIIIGGGTVAKEYYGLPEKTDEDFFNDQGKRWFKTGDIGQMMPNGTIKIIDRKKDLVKLQGGEYVSLGKVESLLKLHRSIDNICLYADPAQTFCVALVIPNQSWLEEAAQRLGAKAIEREDLCAQGDIARDLANTLREHGLSQRLEKFEIPRSVFLVNEPWTPESGLITAAFKLKRRALENFYKDDIAELYAGNNNIVGKKKMPDNKIQPLPAA